MTLYGKRELAFHFVTFFPNHTFTTNTNLLISAFKRQTAEVELLPFAGKTNAMLNLSSISWLGAIGCFCILLVELEAFAGK